MSTRLQIRNALKRRITSRSDLTDPDFDKWINDGMLDLCTRRIQMRSLEGDPLTTSISQNIFKTVMPVTTPTIFALASIVIYAATPTNGYVLKPWDGTLQTLLEAFTNSQGATSRPAYYLVWGGSFYVFPIPDVTYFTLIFPYYRPFLDVADTAVPSIEEEWHYAIELIAAEHAWRDLGDEERAAAAEGEFAAWLAMRDTPLKAHRRLDARNFRAKPNLTMRDPRTGV